MAAAATEFISYKFSYVGLLAFYLAFTLSFTSPAPAEARGNGTAAYYSPDPSSACPNGSLIGEGKFVAMVQDKAFNKGAACGRKYKITCTNGTNEVPEPCKKGQWVTVTVANLCSGDTCATFTVSTDAFDVIAKRDAGRVQIIYKRLRIN